MKSQALAKNIVRIRKARNFSQAEVAATAGISRNSYRKVEKEGVLPRKKTLQAIATSLGVKLPDILEESLPYRKIRFRSFRNLAFRDDILAQTSNWLLNYREVEEISGDFLVSGISALRSDIHGRRNKSTRNVAKTVRERLNLGSFEPVYDLCGLVEKLGIKVGFLPKRSEGFESFSISDVEFGPAIIVNSSDRISIERQIFCVARELGHLILHPDSYEVSEADEVEAHLKEANHFASHLLMPDEGLKGEWGKSSGLPMFDRVLKIKRIYRVSYLSVLFRLVEFGVINEDSWKRFQHEYNSRMRVGSNDEIDNLSFMDLKSGVNICESRRQMEPDNLCGSDFMEVRLSRLVRFALEKGEITTSRAAEILGVKVQGIRELAVSWNATER